MDPIQPTTRSDAPPNELPHVAEELYKKNFELDEKNKTLSLLRKIDEIILSTVTDISQIAQQVADTVTANPEFPAVIIFLNDKKNRSLVQLATSQTEAIKKVEAQYSKSFYSQQISMREEANPVVRLIKEKAVNSIQTLHDLLTPDFHPEEIQVIEEITGIKSCIIYPFVIRQETIGAMVICSATPEKDFSQYQNDLTVRLVEVVGIAIDNALLYQSIQEANERLKDLDKLKDEFVSLASHELRTPMTAIKSYIWLVLQNGNLDAKQKEYLQNTYISTERLIKLVNDMLNVSRIESGRLIIDKKSVNLEQIAEETLTEIAPTAKERGLTVTVEKPATALPTVFADPDKIKEVLMNLVGNSLKFTPSGGNITISFSEKNDLIETHVADNGKGIKQEDISKLFKKFGMIEGNYLKTTTGQGTGLGLYISKSIVELHGGSVWFVSNGENQGSTFSFSLKKG